MKQFLSAFFSKVFSHVSDSIQVKECTTTGLCYDVSPYSCANRTRNPEFLPSVWGLHQRRQPLYY